MIFYKNEKNFFKILFWVWLTLIIIFSYLPKVTIPEALISNVKIRIDYILHYFVYLVLPFFYLMWQKTLLQNRKFILIINILAAGIILSVLNELPQRYIPGRTFNILDIVFNCLGFISGTLLTSNFITERITKKL